MVALAAAMLSAACGGSAQAPARQQGEQASAKTTAPKPASSPAQAKPSPTPDPAGRADPDGGECPGSHQLKGATTATGERLYYEPDRPSYATVTPEVCFTAGGDARAAGYQANRR